MQDFQRFLDATSRAVKFGILELYRLNMDTPLAILNGDTTEFLTTDIELQNRLLAHNRCLRRLRITDLIREAKELIKIDDNLRIGTFTNHILRHGKRVVRPFDSSVTLRRKLGKWKAIALTVSVSHQNYDEPVTGHRTVGFSPQPIQ